MIDFIHIPKAGGSSMRSLFVSLPNARVITHNTRDPNYVFYKDACKKDTSFSFCFVRNPWDRLVSSFFYLKKGGGRGIGSSDHEDFKKYFGEFKNFKDMIRNWDDSFFNQIHFRPQYQWVGDDNKVMVDFVGRFENLQEDFNVICNKIGIPQRRLPHTNKSTHKRYADYYDEETRGIVAKKYAKDIEYFKYKFTN